MTTYSTIRASDADREQVVAILGDAYAAGRLTLAEFDERSTVALTGRTWGALGELTKDLPHQARLGADLRPAIRAASDPPPVETQDPGDRTWRILSLVPVAAVWLVVALSARMPDSVVPVIIALLLLLRCTVSHRPAPRKPARRSDPRSGSGSFR
jgi:Domain of unknown function (DUF1707)